MKRFEGPPPSPPERESLCIEMCGQQVIGRKCKPETNSSVVIRRFVIEGRSWLDEGRDIAGIAYRPRTSYSMCHLFSEHDHIDHIPDKQILTPLMPAACIDMAVQR